MSALNSLLKRHDKTWPLGTQHGLQVNNIFSGTKNSHKSAGILWADCINVSEMAALFSLFPKTGVCFQENKSDVLCYICIENTVKSTTMHYSYFP